MHFWFFVGLMSTQVTFQYSACSSFVFVSILIWIFFIIKFDFEYKLTIIIYKKKNQIKIERETYTDLNIFESLLMNIFSYCKVHQLLKKGSYKHV